jgi:hypothetical protein
VFFWWLFSSFSGALESASDALAMDSVKLPKFSGESRDFDVWKKRFCTFGIMQKWAPALSSDCAASSQQQVDMSSTLILALPEDNLSIIENVSEDDKTCGHSAWTTLVSHVVRSSWWA